MNVEMLELKKVVDPLGHTIIISPDINKDSIFSTLDEIKQIISSPSYIIKLKQDVLYFFRLLDWDLNIAIEARKTTGNHYQVENCITNPTPAFVSHLLTDGVLTSFTI
jgi:hypothetical protein